MRRAGSGSRVPEVRVRAANAAPLAAGDHVLYWMIAARRPGWNFGLQRAVEHARELGKPLLVLEALRADYPWASARLHRFVLDGMAHNARAFAARGVTYHPYVEPRRGAGKGQRHRSTDQEGYLERFVPRRSPVSRRGSDRLR